MPSASRPASRTVGGSSRGRSLPTVSCSWESGTTRAGRTAESDAVVVSSSTSMLLVLAWPSRSTATKVSVSPPRPPSPALLVRRLQRVKSTTPLYGATFQVKTPVPGAAPHVTVTEATPFSETASTATGAFSEMV